MNVLKSVCIIALLLTLSNMGFAQIRLQGEQDASNQVVKKLGKYTLEFLLIKRGEKYGVMNSNNKGFLVQPVFDEIEDIKDSEWHFEWYPSGESYLPLLVKKDGKFGVLTISPPKYLESYAFEVDTLLSPIFDSIEFEHLKGIPQRPAQCLFLKNNEGWGVYIMNFNHWAPCVFDEKPIPIFGDRSVWGYVVKFYGKYGIMEDYQKETMILNAKYDDIQFSYFPKSTLGYFIIRKEGKCGYFSDYKSINNDLVLPYEDIRVCESSVVAKVNGKWGMPNAHFEDGWAIKPVYEELDVSSECIMGWRKGKQYRIYYDRTKRKYVEKKY